MMTLPCNLRKGMLNKGHFFWDTLYFSYRADQQKKGSEIEAIGPTFYNFLCSIVRSSSVVEEVGRLSFPIFLFLCLL